MQNAPVEIKPLDFGSLSIYSLDILARLDQLETDVATAYEDYRFNEIAQLLYEFWWSHYCDWYLESSKGDFFEDKRTQQAVILNLIILGEAATKLMDRYPAIADANPTIPWKSMRGMRNRIAHGYYDINLDVVWDTVSTALPELLAGLANVNGMSGSDR